MPRSLREISSRSGFQQVVRKGRVGEHREQRGGHQHPQRQPRSVPVSSSTVASDEPISSR